MCYKNIFYFPKKKVFYFPKLSALKGLKRHLDFNVYIVLCASLQRPCVFLSFTRSQFLSTWPSELCVSYLFDCTLILAKYEER